MTKERLQQLAGIISESSEMNFPTSVINRKYKYVGSILQFDQPQDHVFNNLSDFYSEVVSGWDKGEYEARKYIKSLSVEGGKIVSTYSGKKTVELERI